MPGPTKLRRYITEVITGEFYCAKWLFISSLCGNCGKFDAYYRKNPILEFVTRYFGKAVIKIIALAT